MTKHVHITSLAETAAKLVEHLDPAEIRDGIHHSQPAEQGISNSEHRKVNHGPRVFNANNRNDGALIKNAPSLKLRRSQNR